MLRNAHIWLPGYLASRKWGQFVSPTHVLFCFVDHFEPYWAKPTDKVARQRVRHWLEHYPKLAKFHDADGRPPQHTFFYPAEEYRPDILDDLAQLCRQGYGEVEIHLHHDNDTAENLRQTIEDFKLKLRNHGFLSETSCQPSAFSGQPLLNAESRKPSAPASPPPSTLHPQLAYAFIHGNWSLDNSRPDGRWCGVNNELQVLRETGCYADFTLPSAPSDTQTRKINSIYYATDDPNRPKSHNTGVDVAVGKPASGDLMIVQGPLALNWHSRKWGVLPRIENAGIAGSSPATAARVDLWVRQQIGVVGRPDWIFVKVHTHGCQEYNFAPALDGRLHQSLQRYNDGQQFHLHYVTAREMFNLVKAAEAGHTGNPNDFRDFVLPPPPVRG